MKKKKVSEIGLRGIKVWLTCIPTKAKPETYMGVLFFPLTIVVIVLHIETLCRYCLEITNAKVHT